MSLSWQQSIGADDSHLVDYQDSLGRSCKVNPAILSDLNQLTQQAALDGVPICIVSAFRSFDRQLSIWNNKWQGHRPVYSRHGRPLNISAMSDVEKYKAISLWSALPGLSRHHWGTDLDIFLAAPIQQGYQVELTEQEFSADGPCAALQLWLTDNLLKFGFFRPYLTFQQGVCAESWHISHYFESSEILQNFDYAACKSYLQESAIQQNAFISSQFDHYTRQYFCNICEVLA